jgi:uncharacterized protein (DUF736 family)
MDIGLLTKTKLDGNPRFFGHVKTMKLNLERFELVDNPSRDSSNPKHPAYLILAKSRDGYEVKIGAAWHREYERNGEIGEMISLSFDDPSFDSALHVTAFKTEDGSWPIQWRRRQEKKAS